MVAERNGDLPVSDLQTIEDLCQPSLNGRGGPIAPIAIQATNFGLKNDMIQQVQNSCQFHGLPGDDAKKHLDKFLHVTQSIKVNGVTDDALRLYLFPHSLTHHATAWLTSKSKQLLLTVKLVVVLIPLMIVQPPLATLRTYMLREPIKGNNQGRNQFFQGASHGQYQPPAYQALVYQAPIHQPQIPQPQVMTTNEFTNFIKANDAILKNMQTNMTSLTNSSLELKNMFVECETEATKDMVHLTNNGSTEDVQPPVVLTESLIQNSELVIAPIIEPIASPISAPKPDKRPSLSYPSRLHDQKLCDKANDQREKIFQIFKDLNFNISFVDALISIPRE
nr:reverse transcriptase domain-containing protein [Tanacetum cinerariifolium]